MKMLLVTVVQHYPGQEFNFENSTSADNLDNFINIMNAVFPS